MDALYTAVATATHGREGRAVSSDGTAGPRAGHAGGAGRQRPGHQPRAALRRRLRRLLRAAPSAWSAAPAKVDVSDAAVTAEVGIGKQGEGFGLKVTLRVELPDSVDEATGRKLVEQAHQVCPYSNATRGNIEVDLVIE